MANPLKELRGRRLEKDAYAPALDFLNLQHGTCAWRHNNDAIWVPKLQEWRRRANHQDGVPDLLGVKRKSDGKNVWGQAFAFEVKRAGQLKEVSEAQRRWMQRFVDCGGIGYFVDEIGEVMESFPEI